MPTPEKDPNTIELFVAEEIKMTELHPDAPQPSREEMLQKVLERRVALSAKYVEPHQKVSRIVTESDINQVLADGKTMHEMCLVGRADYTTAYAIHHSQINDTDPLNFYITEKGEFFINPKIIWTGGDLIVEPEGCMTFPSEPLKPTSRFAKVRMQYQTFLEVPGSDVPRLSELRMVNYNGTPARVAQHEIAHGLGHYVYDDNVSAFDALDTKGTITS